MEKAYELEFSGEKSGSLYVNCCGCAKTEPLHSFGPAWKPHYLIHYIFVAVLIFISVLANVQGTLFMRNLIDEYITPMLLAQSPDFTPLSGAVARVAGLYVV